MSAATSIQAFTDWQKDLTSPPRKYNFLLDGKPYRGAFNRKYEGTQVSYFTGIRSNRNSARLQHFPKGFIVEDEPVETMLDKWVKQERKLDPLIREIPLYSGLNSGLLGVNNESRRIIGYQIVKTDPNTGEKNVLATYYDRFLKEIIKKTNLQVANAQVAEVPPMPPPSPPSPARTASPPSSYSPFPSAPQTRSMTQLMLPGPTTQAALPGPTFDQSLGPARGQAVGTRMTYFADDIRQHVRNMNLTDKKEIIAEIAKQYQVSFTQVATFLRATPDFLTTAGSAPAPAPVLNPNAQRDQIRGKAVFEFMDNNKAAISAFTNTVTERSPNAIAQNVAQQFNISVLPTKNYLRRHPELIDANLRF